MNSKPASPQPTPPPRPGATYRLQFHAGFTFAQATAIVPYLSRLGITHVYASPYLKACAGSLHGYDVIDHHQLNPELGTRADFDAWVEALARHGMSHILDTVPNHMGIATNGNAWWNSVLEHGPSSPYGRFFDIDWEASPRPELRGRVLLPVLGDTYAATLEKGELRLGFDARHATFHLRYYDRQFPIEPASSAAILRHRETELHDVGEADLEEYERLAAALAALPPFSHTDPAEIDRRHQATLGLRRRLASLLERVPALRAWVEANVAAFNGEAGPPATYDLLDRLLAAQPYRLIYWRNAPEEVNYRRFFDINDLAALAMERPEVFELSHQLIFTLFRQGKLAGLRIDHPDGLYDPAGYLHRLQQRYRATVAVPQDQEKPLYVVVEKILAMDEPLRDWSVHGTSGYDFLNHIGALFVDPSAEDSLTSLHEEYTGQRRTFEQIAYEKKLLMLDTVFPGELQRLARQLEQLAKGSRQSSDFALAVLQEALRQTIACFNVYRTYITGARVCSEDQARIEAAVARAIERTHAAQPAVFHYLRDVLLQRYPSDLPEEMRAAWVRWAGRFQQLTAPVTAKGVEDTAFYNYHRLISLNEVGGDPSHFGESAAALHAYLLDRQARWPLALSCLSTHDTKRSEDVRARLNVLSEMPAQWRQHVLTWRRLNAPHRRPTAGGESPDAGEEYLLYQTLVGAWPMAGGAPSPDFVQRIQAYMQKAMREAKVRTSWTTPDAEHEQAVGKFIAAILGPAPGAGFLGDFVPWVQRIIEFGMANSLAQTALRLTAPGVPDTYQGTDLWDLSLVDPDNRRAVDYTLRQRWLDELAAQPGPEVLAELLQQRRDGRLKLYLAWRLLQLRQRVPELFAHGDYLPCETTGPQRDHIFAFARREGDQFLLVAVARFLSQLAPDPFAIPAEAWADTRITVPADGRLTDVLREERQLPDGSLTAARLFTDLPVAVYYSAAGGEKAAP